MGNSDPSTETRQRLTDLEASCKGEADTRKIKGLVRSRR
jgi:hypothetical protein